MRLLVGADRWSAHLSDIDIQPRADQRSAPTFSSRFRQIAENCRRRGGSGWGGV